MYKENVKKNILNLNLIAGLNQDLFKRLITAQYYNKEKYIQLGYYKNSIDIKDLILIINCDWEILDLSDDEYVNIIKKSKNINKEDINKIIKKIKDPNAKKKVNTLKNIVNITDNRK